MQPSRPQVQRAPSIFTTTWPISAAAPRPDPGLAVEDDPAAHAGAPPDSEQRLLRRAAPSANSPSTATCTSLPERDRAAQRAPTARSASGNASSQSGRLRAPATIPASASTAPGEPTPDARRGRRSPRRRRPPPRAWPRRSARPPPAGRPPAGWAAWPRPATLPRAAHHHRLDLGAAQVDAALHSHDAIRSHHSMRSSAPQTAPPPRGWPGRRRPGRSWPLTCCRRAKVSSSNDERRGRRHVHEVEVAPARGPGLQRLPHLLHVRAWRPGALRVHGHAHRVDGELGVERRGGAAVRRRARQRAAQVAQLHRQQRAAGARPGHAHEGLDGLGGKLAQQVAVAERRAPGSSRVAVERAQPGRAGSCANVFIIGSPSSSERPDQLRALGLRVRRRRRSRPRSGCRAAARAPPGSGGSVRKRAQARHLVGQAARPTRGRPGSPRRRGRRARRSSRRTPRPAGRARTRWRSPRRSCRRRRAAPRTGRARCRGRRARARRRR